MQLKLYETILAAGFLLSATPVIAQNYNNPRILPTPEGHSSVNLTLSLSNPVADGESLENQIEATQKKAYELAGKQCEFLTQSVADSCKLLGLSSNVSTQRPAQFSQVTISLQLTLAVRFRDSMNKP